MSAAPNMEMIVASLRSCSLGVDKEVPSPAVEPPPVKAAGEVSEVFVDLNSEVALPYQWEQCLDMKSGEIYFINSASGTRTTEDPRLTGYDPDEEYYSDENSDDDDDDDDDTVSDYNDEDGGGGIGNNIDRFVATDNHSSPEGPSSAAAAAETDPPVLVAAGCTSCLMFIMVPRNDTACPECGLQLMYLGRNGYS